VKRSTVIIHPRSAAPDTHGFLPGLPGAPECVAISRIEELGANASAQILDTGEIELVEW
jgi:hypothetical protein